MVLVVEGNGIWNLEPERSGTWTLWEKQVQDLVHIEGFKEASASSSESPASKSGPDSDQP